MPYRSILRPTARSPSVRVVWVPREPPLAPLAVAGVGAVMQALLQRVQRMDDTQLATLQGVVGPSVLILLGPSDTLPWVDGVTYLGRDPLASMLFLPTALRPDVHVALFERAIVRGRSVSPPVAVLPRDEGLALVSLAAVLPVSRARLAAWAGG